MASRNLPTPAGTRSKPRKVTNKLKAALDAMIWDGLQWDEAARQAGLRVRTMRLAIGKRHVRAYLNEQRHALMAGLSAANISRAAEIRDQNHNKVAALGAIKFLEDGGDPAESRGPVRTPGIVIQIVNR